MDASLGTTISLEFEGRDGKIDGSFIGSDSKTFFIVRVPPDLDPASLFKGKTATATYFSSGAKYRFETTTLHFVPKYQLMVLSYPRQYDTHSLRKEYRVNCQIPATASFDRNSLKGLVTDISHHGCQFIVKIPATFKISRISVITDIDLSLPIFEQPDAGKVKGKVRNTNVDQSKIALGIEFDDLDEQFYRRLQNFIEELEALQ